MTVRWGSNFDDDLAGAPEHAVADPNLAGLQERVKMEFEAIEKVRARAGSAVPASPAGQ